MYESGELISVVYPTMGLKCRDGISKQMKLPGIKAPDLHELEPGDLGIVIDSNFYEEYGWVTEAMFGDTILSDIPSDKLALTSAV